MGRGSFRRRQVLGGFNIAAILVDLACLMGLMAMMSGGARADFEGCLSDSLHALQEERKLLNQLDPRLVEANLALKPGEGGICGPTCAFNLFQALEKKTGVKLPHYEDPVREILGLKRWMKQHRDIRKGMLPWELKSYLQLRLNSQGVRTEVLERAYPAALSPGDLTQPGKGIILAIAGGHGRGGRQFGHFVLVKEVDPERRLIRIVDPNHPDTPYNLSYRVVRDANGIPVIQIAFPKGMYQAEKHPYFRIESVISVGMPVAPNP